MWVALILCLMLGLFSLPGIIIRHCVIRRSLSRRSALILCCALTVAAAVLSAVGLLIIVAVDDHSSLADLRSLSEGWLMLLFLGLLYFTCNLAILTNGREADYDRKALSERYKDIISLDSETGKMPGGSVRSLYKKAKREGISTSEYVERYVPERVRAECQRLSENSEELWAFLRFCADSRVIRNSYVDILYYEYSKRK